MGMLLVCSDSFVLGQASAQSISQQHAKGFVENQGQFCDTDGITLSDVFFKLSTPGLDVYLHSKGISYVFWELMDDIALPGCTKGIERKETRSELGIPNYHRVDLELIGMNVAFEVVPEGSKEFLNHYYTEHSPEGIVGVKTFGKVTFRNVYPNIDWVIYAEEGGAGIKYDFLVHPGGSPQSIRMKYIGAESDSILPSGDFKINTSIGSLIESSPFTYQLDPASDQTKRNEVMSEFIRIENTLGYAIGLYDTTSPLVIDPFITWSTYYGGSNNDFGQDIDIDDTGNIWITGNILSSDFPTSPGAFQATHSGGLDIFIAKFNAAGSRQFATYYGGPADDEGMSIACDSEGNAWITGHTHGLGFPVSLDAYQSALSGTEDAILIKLSGTGTRLYATLYGSTDEEQAWTVAVNDSNDVWMTGFTMGNDFPVTSSAFQGTYGGGHSDAFAVAFDKGGVRIYSSFIGGSDEDEGYGLAIDKLGKIWVCGNTESNDFPYTAAAFQSTRSGSSDGFLIQLSDSGSQLYGTFFGGSGYDSAWQVETDDSLNVWIVGFTSSSNFPVTPGCFQDIKGGIGDNFIAKFSPSGTREYASFIGGYNQDESDDIWIDANNEVWLTGWTYSNDFPVTGNAIQPGISGFKNAYLSRFSNNGQFEYGTFLGGGNEQGMGICGDPNGDIFLTGFTNKSCSAAPGFPLFDPGGSNFYQGAIAGLYDCFLLRLSDSTLAGTGNTCYNCNLSSQFTHSDSAICVGDSISFSYLPGGANRFNWLEDGLLFDTVPNPVRYFNTPGTYEVKLVVGSSFCEDTSSVIVTVFSDPNINLVEDTSYCEMDSLQLDAGTGFTAYLWNGVISSQWLHVDSTGLYEILVSDSNGCSNRDSINVIMYPLPVPIISQIGDSLSTQFASTYQWYLNDTLLTGETNEILAAQVTGFYHVIVTDSAGCSGISGFYFVLATKLSPAYLENQLKLFPNPFGELLNFSFGAAPIHGMKFECIDPLGKIIIQLEMNYQGYTLSIPTQKLKRGLYVVRVHVEGKSYSRRVVKK